jgi:drug/metabolite transporter (DMT)-like permease
VKALPYAQLHLDGPRAQRRGAVFGLTAALLFGASAPLAKRLLPGVTPLMLAALLYGGAGLALLAWGLVRRALASAAVGAVIAGAGALTPSSAVEASLRASDVPALAGIVLLGGVVGPICMLVGIARLSGVSGALLLNLEAPLTALLAVLIFREHLGVRGVVAIVLVVGGAALLGAGEVATPGQGSARGALAVAAACLAWAIDNNLTQRLSVRDPIAVVRIKALGAAACNLALAFGFGSPLPAAWVIAAALLVGAASYGVSVVLDFHALRILGAAREAAYFATAPFAGALVAIPLFGQRPGRAELLAGATMVAGVIALFRDRHGHPHTHEAIAHDHVHVHDQHHRHAHDHPAPNAGAAAAGPGHLVAGSEQPHSHWHVHDPVAHEHPHSSDIHHRHRH